MKFARKFNLLKLIKRKSILLFGPRQTGKSTYLKTNFTEALTINLLRPDVYRELLRQPELLEKKILAHDFSESKKLYSVSIVIIDEVQKIPDLLDVVHLLIEQDKNLRFILTGSSARKIKSGNANLLGGRAQQINIFPITWSEMKTDLTCKRDLDHLLLNGSLPSILDSTEPMDDLDNYVTTYLKEEVNQEGIVRSLAGFSRFLNFAALRNGEQLNYTNLANDAQVSPVTVKEYFYILSDTLLGKIVPVFNVRPKRKVSMSEKFYFFDTGVCNAIIKRRSLVNESIEYGHLLETYIFNEINSFINYEKKDHQINFWRTNSKLEVDFILAPPNSIYKVFAIELKATAHPTKKATNSLLAFEEEYPGCKKILVCRCNSPLVLEGDVLVLPVDIFLNKLWAHEII
jgi:predicted AAA+ superfamily ATPase